MIDPHRITRVSPLVCQTNETKALSDVAPDTISGTPTCRFCAAPLTTVFADLGWLPVANAFRSPCRLAEPEPYLRLRACVCDRCLLAQLDTNCPPDSLFHAGYPYFSSYSTTWLAHVEQFAARMVDALSLDAESKVVEIASNDGCLLAAFKRRGIPVLGIEPSASVARAAINDREIPTVMRFFTRNLARDLYGEGVRADLIVANNVLAHVDDINDFLSGLPLLLKEDGVATFEFQHILEIIRNVQFDTIYHEHYSYLSLLSLERIVAVHGLKLFDAEQLSTHGGSLRAFVCKAGSRHAMTPSDRVDRIRNLEIRDGLSEPVTYERFGEKINALKRRLTTLLLRLKDEGYRIAAYGAPAKGTILLNACGIHSDIIDFAVDRNPHKQGLYFPGTGIPVHDPSAVFEGRPDFLLILPWNIKAEIMQQMREIAAWNGRFIVPLPEPTIIPA